MTAPPMLRPAEFDRVLSAARQRAASALRTQPVVAPRAAIALPKANGAAPGARKTLALPSDPTASGTGINPWWRYQEQSLPGGGHVMVNVGTGNMLLQDDDMSIAHKGIALAFRRTYNSQSLHNVNASDGTGQLWEPPGMYGNGWTNTFDAHVTRTNGTLFSVYDIDGARYDYTQTVFGGIATFTPMAGNHNTLTFDGACGFLWTKKSGTTYYFYRPNPVQSCGALTATGGFAGRLYQIVGRNHNTSITFTYAWDNGDASSTGKIGNIYATTESGQTATLQFADFSGHRLLQMLVYPDNTTAVYYGYDASGNLTNIGKPPNNTAQTLRGVWYGYQAIGSDSVMQYVASPRWVAACTTACGSDGNVLNFGFSGSSASASALSSIQHRGVVNPPIGDGTPGAGVQPGYTTTNSYYLTEYYTTGVTTPTYRDTDGHMTNWIVDGIGHPSQTQQCTATAGQGTACTGTWLTTNESWDADNNMTAQIDPRGNETDYAYDANGNTIAVGEAATSTIQGRFRPTLLFDYDGFNNIVAACDQTATHAAGADWTGTPAVSDTLCSSRAAGVPHARFAFSYPASEPFGELTTLTTPLGYNRQISYNAAYQGGADFGLPTDIVGDPIVGQNNGTSRQPHQEFHYDTAGNLVCYGSDANDRSTFTVLSYDQFNRTIAVGDPDDGSLSTPGCSRTPTISAATIVTRTTYFMNGAIATVQTPSEAAKGVASAFQYDMDGNQTTITRHFSDVVATTTKWYDGEDRLVEVSLPRDPTDVYSFPWMTRYLYDLTQAGNPEPSTSASFKAYGGLFATQKFIPGAIETVTLLPVPGLVPGVTPSWIESSEDSFDASGRQTAHYFAVPGSVSGMVSSTTSYDQTPQTLGLTSGTARPDGSSEQIGYDELGRVVARQYTLNAAQALSVTYDVNGKQAVVNQSDVGAQQFVYDADGRLIRSVEPPGGTVALTSPATLSYGYYADGMRSTVSVASSGLNQSNFLQYSYRGDGHPSVMTLAYGTPKTFTRTYTGAGRLLTQSDPLVSNAVTATYDAHGRTASYALPSGTFSGFARDAEDEPTSFTSTAGTFTQTYSVRGELLTQLVPGNGGQTYAQNVSMAAGTSIDYNTAPLNNCYEHTNDNGRIDSACGVWNRNFDARNGGLLGDTWAWTDGNGLCNNQYGACTPQTTPTAYDQDGRRGYQVYWPGGANNLTNYDYQDRTLKGATLANALGSTNPLYIWGPNGHPVLAGGQTAQNAQQPPRRTIHWDGDDILFVTNDQSQVEQIRLPLVADIYPRDLRNVGLYIWDRDFAGYIVGAHNASGHTGLYIRSASNVCNGSTQPSSGFNAPSTIYEIGCWSASPGIFTQVRPDGISDGFNLFQGVRAYDPGTNSWTSPDAYSGSIHDPMSQMPYMWNRNNPYQYSDPSGYNPQDIVAGFDTWLQNVTRSGVPGGPEGRSSGGLSPRNIDAVAKELRGEMPGDGHTVKFRQALQGGINRFNAAAAQGARDVITKATDAYNEAVGALKGLGVKGADLERALTGPRGGANTPTVKLPESIPVEPVPVKIEVPIVVP